MNKITKLTPAILQKIIKEEKRRLIQMGLIQENGKFPAPDQGISTDLRARLLDIRGVDIKLIFRSKEHFFKKAQARTVVGLSDRNLSTTDRYLRDSVIVSVYTRNIGGAFWW